MSGTPDERALIRLVDDDEDFLEGLAFVLEAKGWKTAGYLSPRDFLTSDRPSVPGCLILDIRMPEMSGIELQREMKARGIDLPIIILTGHADVESAVKTLKMGAVDFLLKPFHDGDLENAVLALQKRIAAQTAPQPEPLPGVKPGPKSRYVREAMVYLEQNCGSGDLSVGQAAAQLGLSEGHLSHLFKKETDMTLGAYLTRCRIQKAMALLREGKLKVYEVAEACGYRDIAYFSGTFKKITGKTPSEYQDSLSFRF